MFTQDYQQQHVKILGQEEEIEDSCVPSGSEKTWTILLEIPSDAVAPDLTGCSIIKMQCEIIVSKTVFKYLIRITNILLYKYPLVVVTVIS